MYVCSSRLQFHIYDYSIAFSINTALPATKLEKDFGKISIKKTLNNPVQ